MTFSYLQSFREESYYILIVVLLGSTNYRKPFWKRLQKRKNTFVLFFPPPLIVKVRLYLILRLSACFSF